MLHPSGMDLRELEKELFELKTRNEITVAPLREYIEELLRRTLIKIIKLEQQETVASVMPHQPQQASTKEAPPRK